MVYNLGWGHAFLVAVVELGQGSRCTNERFQPRMGAYTSLEGADEEPHKQRAVDGTTPQLLLSCVASVPITVHRPLIVNASWQFVNVFRFRLERFIIIILFIFLNRLYATCYQFVSEQV